MSSSSNRPVGIPAGGTTNQVLTKNSNADFDTKWAAGGGGGGAVSSVFTRTGDVVAQSGDYNTLQVTENTNLYFTTARARAAISNTAPIGYNSSTGAISITQATTSTDGYLSSTNWNTFNGKQAGPLTGDVTTSGAASTLATVNSNVGSFTSANITVNAKGLITAATNGSGGGGSPGGSDTQVQYNNSGAFAATANFVWDYTDNFLGLGSYTFTPNARLHVFGTTSETPTIRISRAVGSETAGLLMGFPTSGFSASINYLHGSTFAIQYNGNGMISASAPTTVTVGNGMSTVNISPNGTVNLTATTTTIGFLGQSPAAKQTGGAATAGVVYTATEQAMLQTVYDALRTFGLLT